MKVKDVLSHAWHVFSTRSPTPNKIRNGSISRPDRHKMTFYNERSIVSSIYNRISLDVASMNFMHCRVDDNGFYTETIKSKLNDCISLSANLDQTGDALIQDIVISMFDEGVVAVVPTVTDNDITLTDTFGIEELRVAKIIEWFPYHVRVEIYNDQTGNKEELILPKKSIAIIENPMYSVMNEPNSTLRRLTRKLAMLDDIDEQTSSGKLDIIIQLPYSLKSKAKQEAAEERRNTIESQLKGSKYGIAYIDETEHITQLNRPAENNLLKQIEYLTSSLYNQLGYTEALFNGTATEEQKLDYLSKSVIPTCNAIVNEFNRKFLSKTARSQGQKIWYLRDPFSLVPVSELATLADKLTRNEILTSNEVRSIIGFKPSKDPRADQLLNKNIRSTNDQNQNQNEREETDDEQENL